MTRGRLISEAEIVVSGERVPARMRALLEGRPAFEMRSDGDRIIIEVRERFGELAPAYRIEVSEVTRTDCVVQLEIFERFVRVSAAVRAIACLALGTVIVLLTIRQGDRFAAWPAVLVSGFFVVAFSIYLRRYSVERAAIEELAGEIAANLRQT